MDPILKAAADAAYKQIEEARAAVVFLAAVRGGYDVRDWNNIVGAAYDHWEALATMVHNISGAEIPE
jgi:hypothetical protein